MLSLAKHVWLHSRACKGVRGGKTEKLPHTGTFKCLVRQPTGRAASQSFRLARQGMPVGSLCLAPVSPRGTACARLHCRPLNLPVDVKPRIRIQDSPGTDKFKRHSRKHGILWMSRHVENQTSGAGPRYWASYALAVTWLWPEFLSWIPKTVSCCAHLAWQGM